MSASKIYRWMLLFFLFAIPTLAQNPLVPATTPEKPAEPSSASCRRRNHRGRIPPRSIFSHPAAAGRPTASESFTN